MSFFSFNLRICLFLSLSLLFVLHLSPGVSWAAAASGNPIFSYQQWQSTGNPRGARPAGKSMGCGWRVSGPWPLVRSPSPPHNPGASDLWRHALLCLPQMSQPGFTGADYSTCTSYCSETFYKGFLQSVKWNQSHFRECINDLYI